MTAGALRFDGRVAIVTGAGRGIGRAHALLLASRGASVVVNDFGGEVDGGGRSERPAHEVAAAIRDTGGTAVADCRSVADDDGPAAIVATAFDAFGRLDIVVNNAGNIIPGFFLEQTRDDFRRLFDVHVLGTMSVCQAAWPHFVAQSYGRIVNTSSPSFTGLAGFAGYASMKGALVSLTAVLALEGADHGILVNAIAPSAWSRMAEAMPAAVFSAERLQAMRETRDPRLVAPMAAYLAHESCATTGGLYYAGGGEIRRYSVERSRAFASETLTIEDVAANIGSLSDEN